MDQTLEIDFVLDAVRQALAAVTPAIFNFISKQTFLS